MRIVRKTPVARRRRMTPLKVKSLKQMASKMGALTEGERIAKTRRGATKASSLGALKSLAKRQGLGALSAKEYAQLKKLRPARRR